MSDDPIRDLRQCQREIAECAAYEGPDEVGAAMGWADNQIEREMIMAELEDVPYSVVRSLHGIRKRCYQQSNVDARTGLSANRQQGENLENCDPKPRDMDSHRGEAGGKQGEQGVSAGNPTDQPSNHQFGPGSQACMDVASQVTNSGRTPNQPQEPGQVRQQTAQLGVM